MYTPTFGTLKGAIKLNLSANFGGNPIKIRGVMTNYSCKIRLNFRHTRRVNHFEESIENWCVVRLTIIGVCFGGLKEITIMTTKIQCKNQQCVTIMRSCNRINGMI